MSMKIAVALGGEYADFLIGLLMEKKYKVTVIDPDKASVSISAPPTM